MLIAFKRNLIQFSCDPCILIGNHNIKQVTNRKVLGITLGDELRWRKHIMIFNAKNYPRALPY
jgi:hypothetical protein